MSNYALIDADELVYKIALSYQKTYYVVKRDDKELWKAPSKQDAIESIGNEEDLEIESRIEVFPEKGYEQKVTQSISSILTATNSVVGALCLSGENNFRRTLAKLLPYKGNRSIERPALFETVRTNFLERGAEYINHLEADDLLVVKYNENPERSIICSTDKDLRTVSSRNYNISKGKLTYINQWQALYNFYYQMLIGDSVDNIPSPYGMGPQTAQSILIELLLNECSELYYYDAIIDPYYDLINKKDKKGNYKTKWYNGQPLSEIFWEIGNLLYMHRTLDPNERWEPPVSHEEIEERIASKKEKLEPVESCSTKIELEGKSEEVQA